MNTPPNKLVVELKEQDIQENLVKILESMNKIREESLVNLESTDEQKMEYLRLTQELAGCVNAFITENKLEDHTSAVMKIVKEDTLLRHYDPLQEQFWKERQPQLKKSLEDASIVILRDDYTSETQQYHLFQALKYLNIKDNAEDVYETILPINSLLNEHSWKSPEVCKQLAKTVFSINNSGVRVYSSELNKLIEGIKQTGALYVDIPKKNYETIKEQFPQARIVEEDNEKYTRIIFGSPENKTGYNPLKRLQQIAQLDVKKAENSLIKKPNNIYNFGKEFIEAIKEKIRLKEEKKKRTKKSLEEFVQETNLDEEPVDHGGIRSREGWAKYWYNTYDGRSMANMSDFYKAFKQLKQMTEKGNKKEKDKAQKIVESLREDFKLMLMSGTRINQNNNQVLITKGYDYNNLGWKELPGKIPIFFTTAVEHVVQSTKGYEFLKELMDTNDDPQTIIQTLEFISDKNRNNIVINTNPVGRNLATGFYYSQSNKLFLIDTDINYSSIIGRTRGVLVDPKNKNNNSDAPFENSIRGLEKRLDEYFSKQYINAQTFNNISSGINKILKNPSADEQVKKVVIRNYELTLNDAEWNHDTPSD